jgi:riboflavin kinase/FMN adenylyltransferase
MDRGTAVSIGTFDGVHAGHVALLQQLSAQARKRALPSLLLTFIPPPQADTSHTPLRRHLLLPLQARLALLGRHVDIIQTATVDSVRTLSPERFAHTVLVRSLQTRVVVEGESFRFGCGRSGDVGTLRRLGTQLGFDVVPLPPVLVDREPVSSTRIRLAVQQGDLRLARQCLGRPLALFGTVVRGDQLGALLGYPTANLAVDPLVLLPPNGVYVVHAWGDGPPSDGLRYIGRRPTLGGHDLRCEVHLLDAPHRSLYDQFLEVHILERIREDRTFSSLIELKAQMARDLAAGLRTLAQHPRELSRILG